MLVVPNGEKRVIILHHGSLFSRGLEIKPESIFIAGNRELSPIKILNINEAVLAIGSGNLAATCPQSIDTPLMEHFFDITSKDDFQALRAEDKHQLLKDRPNHMLIHS